MSNAKRLSLVVGFLVAVGTSALSSPVGARPDDDGGGCPGSCGPAPCCVILWTTFCGCPWGDTPEQVE